MVSFPVEALLIAKIITELTSNLYDFNIEISPTKWNIKSGIISRFINLFVRQPNLRITMPVTTEGGKSNLKRDRAPAETGYMYIPLTFNYFIKYSIFSLLLGRHTKY